MNATNNSLRLKLLILFGALCFCSNIFSATIYVNDGSTTGDVYCTAVGNDLNSGLTAALPKLTLAAALAIANNGDVIYVDYGNFNDVGLAINKEVQIIGAGEEMTVFRRTSGVNRWGVISANNVKVSKLTITEYNLASDGIAIWISSGTGVEFNRVTIYANVGSAGQGAVWITGATTSATFKNSGSPCNRVGAANYGGAFKIEEATAVIDNCSINNNIISALYGGGVLVTGNNTNVTIINTTFDDNQANSGGALAVTGSNCTVNVSGSCFNNNRATVAVSSEGGGAVFLRPTLTGSTSNINFSNCSFNNNSSSGGSSDGGAVCITNQNSPNININFTTCSFQNNATADDGDDIFFRKALAAVYNITFKNNTFYTVFAGSKVNLYNDNLLASEIKFEGLTIPTGTSANGDIVASPGGVSVDRPEMFGVFSETSSALPSSLPVTRCIDRFDGVCGAASVTIACVTPNIWDGTTWSKGAPTIFQHVILNANYNTQTHGNINACQMTVKPGVTLDIVDGVDGTYVYVVNSIFNDGIINVKSKANLVQVNHPLDLNDEAIVTPVINFTKDTGDKIRWDYVYWSKPVSNAILSTFNANFDLKYYWDPDYCINGVNFSYQGWQTLSTEPSIATGFITRVKTAAGIIPTNINLNYSGTSNNGEYTAIVKYYDDEHNAFRNFTLLGNPYPGAIKFEDFYNDNNDKIYGTVYLWSANTPYPGSGLYQQADYASFNLTGGVGVPGASTQTPNGILPNGYIASAQGFMVRPKVNGTVTFKNSHRTKETQSNNQFYRISNEQKDRFWLRLQDANGRFNELLIGYIAEATNSFDEAYDGPINSLSPVKFYSVLESEKLIIQGRATFDHSDRVQLDYDLLNPSTLLTISLSKKEGIFNSQSVYLYDKKMNFYHDLTQADYIFNNDGSQERFEIVYRKNKSNELIIQNDISIQATFFNSNFSVISSIDISKIELYDINGRLILYNELEQNILTYTKNIVLADGVYIVNITCKNGIKKAIKILNQN